jgi:hypothetical protein
MAVVWWLVEPIVKGVIAWVAVEGIKRIWRRARWGDDDGEAEPRRVLVNRTTAVLLAAAAVKEAFGVEEELVLEAAEEPPTIAGREITEPGFFWVEPWVVLLRSHDAQTRFIVVVDPHGEVLGTMMTPMGEFEGLYFRPDAG